MATMLIIALFVFVQEGKAEQALESIQQMLSSQAKVSRDGRRETVSAEDLVADGIVLIESGDRVPTDPRLMEARRFRSEDASLAGEPGRTATPRRHSS